MKNFLRELDGNMSRMLSPVVKWTIYLCVGIFAITLVGGSVSQNVPGFMVHLLGASLSDSIFKGRIWQLLSYAFVHGGFGHLFFNLLALYFFGQRLEHRWGSTRFAEFCTLAAIGAVFTHLLVIAIMYTVSGGPTDVIIIGLSGVIYGIMVACALYYPDDIVYFQLLIPIKLKYLVAIMAVLTFISSSQGGNSVAHLTHLGGLLVGFLYVKYPHLFQWIPQLKNPFRKKAKIIDPRDRWRNHR